MPNMPVVSCCLIKGALGQVENVPRVPELQKIPQVIFLIIFELETITYYIIAEVIEST